MVHALDIKNRVLTFIFLLFYTANVFISNISNSQYFISLDNHEMILGKIKIILYAIGFLLIFFYKFNKHSFLDYLLIPIFILSYYYSGIGLTLFFLFIFSKYIKFDLILKCFLISIFCGAVFVYVTYVFDMYEYSDVNFYRESSNGEIVFRYPLGYVFSTYLPNVFLYVFLSWVVLRNHKLSVFEFIFLSFLNYVLYDFTDTRTVFYLVNLLMFVLIFMRMFNIDYKTKLLGRVLKFLTIYSFLFFALLSILIQVFYDPNSSWMFALNKALSGRLAYGYYAYDTYGLSILGQHVEYVDLLDVNQYNKLFVVDSGYLKVLLDQGIVLFIFILFGFFRLGKRIVLKNNIYLGLAIIFSLVNIMINPHLLLITFNPFIFLLAYDNKNENSIYI